MTLNLDRSIIDGNERSFARESRSLALEATPSITTFGHSHENHCARAPARALRRTGNKGRCRNVSFVSQRRHAAGHCRSRLLAHTVRILDPLCYHHERSL